MKLRELSREMKFAGWQFARFPGRVYFLSNEENAIKN